MEGDRARWNARWRERAGELESPSAFLVEHAHLLPPRGRALDVAAGAGRHAIWLARHGFEVTLIDVSEVALERAERRATSLGIVEHMRFVRADLETDELPAPVFDLVLMTHYLDRARRDDLARLAFEGGLVVAMQPTVHNLERHDHPRRDYLLEPGELAAWLSSLGFELLVSREGWNAEGRHEAEVIARRGPPRSDEPDESSAPDGPYR